MLCLLRLYYQFLCSKGHSVTDVSLEDIGKIKTRAICIFGGKLLYRNPGANMLYLCCYRNADVIGYHGSRCNFLQSWQISFCVCALPMRDDVTLQRRLSLIGRKHKIVPDMASSVYTMPAVSTCISQHVI